MQLTERVYLCGSGALGLSAKGDCHTYVIRDRQDLAMVDCGMAENPEAIIATMKKDGLDAARVKFILLTHAHFDHVGGCEYFRTHYQTKIVCSAYEAEVLSAGPVNFFHMDAEDPALASWKNMPAFEPDILIGDQDEICLGTLRIRAVLTPGHTRGSVCYEMQADGQVSLFAGDTVFYNGFISLLSPPFSYYEGYREGVLKLKGKNIDGLYPSHLMWTTVNGQRHIDIAIERFQNYLLPVIKPFS